MRSLTVVLATTLKHCTCKRCCTLHHFNYVSTFASELFRKMVHQFKTVQCRKKGGGQGGREKKKRRSKQQQRKSPKQSNTKATTVHCLRMYFVSFACHPLLLRLLILILWFGGNIFCGSRTCSYRKSTQKKYFFCRNMNRTTK